MSFIHVSSNKNQLAQDFAEWLYREISQSQGSYHISLSGGSTPQKLFDILAASYADKIPWERVHLWWGDERMVPPDHPESNYGMTVSRLLSGVDIPGENVHRIRGEDDPEQEAARYAREITAFLEDGDDNISFDMMILGMGEDGHTASIFPDSLTYVHDTGLTFVATHPESGQLRISLTGSIINNSHRIAFLLAGESKKEKLRAIMDQKEEAKAYPAFHIHAHRVGAELHWFLDEAALGKKG